MGASQCALLEPLPPCGELPVPWGGRARQGLILPRSGRELLQQGQGSTQAIVWVRLSARSDWWEFPRSRYMYVDPDGRQSLRTPDDRSTSEPFWPRRLAVVRGR